MELLIVLAVVVIVIWVAMGTAKESDDAFSEAARARRKMSHEMA